MGDMEMPLPENTLPMMTGRGPFGGIDMGGMFTVLKVSEGLARNDYKDPGWYKHPPGTVAHEWTRRAAARFARSRRSAGQTVRGDGREAGWRYASPSLAVDNFGSTTQIAKTTAIWLPMIHRMKVSSSLLWRSGTRH